jgi:hypothetical protein
MEATKAGCLPISRRRVGLCLNAFRLWNPNSVNLLYQRPIGIALISCGSNRNSVHSGRRPGMPMFWLSHGLFLRFPIGFEGDSLCWDWEGCIGNWNSRFWFLEKKQVETSGE